MSASASRHRIARFLADSLPIWEPESPPRTTFYREEFVKCQQCLEEQREHFSETAVHDVERALGKVLEQLDHLCAAEDADQVVSRLLRQFDLVTGASGWTDPRQVH
jgi:hypothetical protein